MSVWNSFDYNKTKKKLKKLGCEPRRQAAGSHEIWCGPTGNPFIFARPHRGDKKMRVGTLKEMLRQAGIKSKDFLNA